MNILQNNTIPELLSPVGTMESMYAAVNNGADSIYVGGKNFSARSSAKNFTNDELKAVIEYARLRNVNVYVAINTLYKDSEINDVLLFAQKMYMEGANAFILQDIGVAMEIKKNLPEIELHASTQMSIHSLEGAKYIEKLGFSRVVLSRELSTLEITQINSNINIQTEVFVHGALCVSYSGQCLMSSLLGGRSGNRGKCAQTCRLKYDLLKNGKSIKNNYLLSPKDIMTLGILKDIVETGVSSLKIEGRMKSPEYVAIVTKAYREQLDKIKLGETLVDKDTVNNVTQIFNRGGSFSKSYFKNYSGKDMMSNKTSKSTGILIGTVVNYSKGECTIEFNTDLVPGDGIEIWTSTEPHVGTSISKVINEGQLFKISIDGDIEEGNKVYKSYDKRLMDNCKKLYQNTKRQLNIQGNIQAKIGSKLKVSIFYNGIIVTKEGEIVEKAENTPTPKEKIIKQLSKTGNTPYIITYNNIDIDENIYIGVTKLNELRRSIIEEFEQKQIHSFKREYKNISVPPMKDILVVNKQKLSVQVKNIQQLSAVLNKDISRVYFEYKKDILEDISIIINNCENNSIDLFIALSGICRNESENILKNNLIKLEDTNIRGYLVSNYGQLEILESLNTNKEIMLNHNFNTFNNLAVKFFKERQVGVTLSQELNVNELNSINGNGCELIIHGRQTLMTTHQCPIGLYDGGKVYGKYCKLRNNSDTYSLLDRKGFSFPIVTDCDNCIAFILNSKILSMYTKYNDIQNLNIEFLRLIFNDEDAIDVAQTVTLYTNMIDNLTNISHNEEATYGHFYRGVE